MQKNMNKNLIATAAFLLALSLFVYGCASGSTGGNNAAASQQNQPQPPPQGAPAASAGHAVEITAAGFSPKTLTISAGETVTFANKDAAPHWPASAVHPTHAVYPETGGCIGSKFDACRGLNQGESFAFTFNAKGTWKYHDHLNPGTTGTIEVQ